MAVVGAISSKFGRGWLMVLFLAAWVAVFALFNFSINFQASSSDRVQLFTASKHWLYSHQFSASANDAVAVRIGKGGGFASQLEMAAVEFRNVIARGKVAVVTGDYQFYTANEICQQHRIRGDGGTCFFRPVTNLTLRGQDSESYSELSGFDTIAKHPVPGGIPAGVTPSMWWGVVLSYMFRLNTRMEKRCSTISADIGMNSPPDIGVHIRLGDKIADIASKQTQFHNMTTAGIVYMYIQEIERAAADIRMRRCSSWNQVWNRQCPPVVVYVASDSREAIDLVDDWGNSTKAPPGVVVVGRRTRTQNASGRGKQIRVQMRNMTSSDNYAMAEEIIYDMHILRQSRVVIGLVMSQVARAVASMSYASGRLEYAVAMDFDNTRMFSHDPQWRAPRGPMAS
jgi:hypothetical protein